jgi:hypothetical protein
MSNNTFNQYDPWFENESQIPSSINYKKIFQSISPTIASVAGDVQGGKTNIALKLSHKCILSGYPVILVILDRDAGKLQLQSRLERYNKDFKKWCEKKQLETIPLKYLFIKDCKDPVVISRFLKNNMVVSYINQSQLSVLLPLLKNNFLLITDEIDYAIKDSECKVAETYYNICKKSKIHIGVSATSFKFWYKEHQVCSKLTFKLEQNKYYKGINDIVFKYPIDKEIFSPSQEDDCLEVDEEFKTFLTCIEKEGVFKNTNTETGEEYIQPPITLYVPSSYTKHHNEVFNYIKGSLKRRAKWMVIQYDGQDGCPIKLYCSEFEGKYKIKNNIYVPRNNVYYISNNSLSDVLGSLRNVMYKNNFYKNILIVAGRLATRQVSYVCDKYIWHLSHLRILRSSLASCTELVQSMRLFGIFKDDMPLTLSCRNIDYIDIKKYVSFQNHVIDRVKSDEKYLTMFEGAFGEESIKFEKQLLPKERLDKYINKTEIKVDKIMKKMSIEKQIEYIKMRLQEKQNTNISKFIGKIDIQKLYTKNQLEKLLIICGYQKPEWYLNTRLLKDTEQVPGRLFDTVLDMYIVRKELLPAWV